MMNKIPCKNNDIIWRKIEGETVLLNPMNGKYFGLNTVGASFWEKVDGISSVGEIIDLLLQEFEVEEQILIADITELISSMESNDLLMGAAE